MQDIPTRSRNLKPRTLFKDNFFWSFTNVLTPSNYKNLSRFITARADSVSEEVLPPSCEHPPLQHEESTFFPAGKIPLGPGDLCFCT